MATTFTKTFLSASVNGRNIEVRADGSASYTPIHTTPAGTGSIDEVWIWATNNLTSSISMSLMWGGSTATDDYVWSLIAPQDAPLLVIPGWILQNGLTIGAFTQTNATASINVNGYVNRITTT